MVFTVMHPCTGGEKGRGSTYATRPHKAVRGENTSRHQLSNPSPPSPIQLRHRCETDTIKRHTSSTQRQQCIIPYMCVLGVWLEGVLVLHAASIRQYNGVHIKQLHARLHTHSHRTSLHALVSGRWANWGVVCVQLYSDCGIVGFFPVMDSSAHRCNIYTRAHAPQIIINKSIRIRQPTAERRHLTTHQRCECILFHKHQANGGDYNK